MIFLILGPASAGFFLPILLYFAYAIWRLTFTGPSMNIFKAFATDPKLEEEGRWVAIGGTDEAPTEILVARTGTRRYNAVMAQQYEANRTILDSKDTAASNAKVEQMVQHALASCVLLGWKHVEGEDGLPLAYSYANAHKLLGMRDFREIVTKEADKFQMYKRDQLEADAKNSKPA